MLLWLLVALQQVASDPLTVTQAGPVTVNQSPSSMIWLATINVISLVLLAALARWADSRKDRATAKATAEAAVLAAKIKAEEKQLDWARQDEVARRVADAATQASTAAKLLVDTQAEVVRRQDEVARHAAEADQRVQDQLRAIDEQGKKIHILVNSDMTAARTAERDSLKLLAISLKNSLALSVKLGLQTAGDEEVEIQKVMKRVQTLDLILADRHQAQLIVEAEARASGTSALPPDISGGGGSSSPLQKDQDSRPADTIISDAAASLKDIAKSTAETAANTKTTK